MWDRGVSKERAQCVTESANISDCKAIPPELQQQRLDSHTQVHMTQITGPLCPILHCSQSEGPYSGPTPWCLTVCLCAYVCVYVIRASSVGREAGVSASLYILVCKSWRILTVYLHQPCDIAFHLPLPLCLNNSCWNCCAMPKLSNNIVNWPPFFNNVKTCISNVYFILN